ncbi:2Fe-2S iron-sulfur cluster-binding protein [Shewanella sp. GXUN23E]|uniref:2Fe-2S iron-sulfur cluster-binding protein n=1 Tax=Shewanella sp. GXUN23E TaxID=3422498 RepID=UPI003D7DE2D2
MSSRFHRLQVTAVIAETADAWSLVLTVPASLADAFSYRSGQFLTFRVAHPQGTLQRCYSMSSSPGIDTGIRVTVKRVTDGRVSNWLCDTVKAGDWLEVMVPGGRFVCDDFNQDLLLCAGGSGITPVFSLLQTALEQGQGRIRLIYANRDEASVIFKDKLRTLAADYPDRLEIIHLLDSLNGIPSRTLLSSLAREFVEKTSKNSSSKKDRLVNAQAFICGPGPFMDAMEAVLTHLGMGSTDIFIERFVSPPDAQSAAGQRKSDEPKLPESSPKAALARVELDGQRHEFAWDSADTLLEAAEKVGVELPWSCRAGLCASCQCEVTSGKVALRSNEVLDERDLARGLTLSCQALPLSDTVDIRYT